MDIPFPGRPSAGANRLGAWKSVPWGSLPPRGGSAQFIKHTGHCWAMWPGPFWASSNAQERVSCCPADWEAKKRAKITGKAAPMLTLTSGGAPGCFRRRNRPHDKTYYIVCETYDIVRLREDIRHRIRHGFSRTNDIVCRTYHVVCCTYDVEKRTMAYVQYRM